MSPDRLAESAVMRAVSFLFAAFVTFAVPAVVSAQGSKLFQDAKVEALDAKTKCATFVIEQKGRRRNAPPIRHQAVIREEDMRRELESGRKVRATLAALQAGQRVRVTILFSRGISSPNWATDLVILNPKSR